MQHTPTPRPRMAPVQTLYCCDRLRQAALRVTRSYVTLLVSPRSLILLMIFFTVPLLHRNLLVQLCNIRFFKAPLGIQDTHANFARTHTHVYIYIYTYLYIMDDRDTISEEIGFSEQLATGIPTPLTFGINDNELFSIRQFTWLFIL